MGSWWGRDASFVRRVATVAVATAVGSVTFAATPVAAAEVGSGPEGPVAVSTLTLDRDTVGLVDPASGRWRLLDAGGDTASFYFGDPGDVPFMGDWDCDGIDTPGAYRSSDGFVYLRNSNTQGVADVEFYFGDPGDVPVAGDFDGDGCDTVGVFRPSVGRVFLIDRLGAAGSGLGSATRSIPLGDPGDIPFAGDLDGDGSDDVGVYRSADASVHTGAGDHFDLGDPGDRLVIGDWSGTRRAMPAVFRPGTGRFHLATPEGFVELRFGGAVAGMLPVSGSFGDLTPDAAPAAGSGPGEDPLGLVPEAAALRTHSLGEDRFAVWRCDIGGWSPAASGPALGAVLDGVVAGWFTEWSGGRYLPVFTILGRVGASSRTGCLAAARDATPPGFDAALVVTNDDLSGLASPGPLCLASVGCHETGYPSNGRVAMVGMTALEAAPATVVHEIGHTLQWPHSRSGTTGDAYDNPMDVMSGAVRAVVPGTIAFNRYQAGWIDAEQVAIYPGGRMETELLTVGHAGLQMIVVPTGVAGRFYVAGARTASAADPVPASGVEVYLVDQMCTGSASVRCIGAAGKRFQTPPAADGFGHVVGPGGSSVVGRVRLTVTAASDGGFHVVVEPTG